MLFVAAFVVLLAEGTCASCTYSYTTIREAFCNGSGMHDVPADIRRDVQILSLSDNNITAITNQFIKSDCGVPLQSPPNFTVDSWSCSRFPNLAKLNLSNNQIEELSDSFLFGMKLMMLLTISKNKLKNIHPNTFFFSKYLKLLDISENFIEFIHPNLFQKLAFLMFLDISNNKIVYFHPDTFIGLGRLALLNVKFNFITRLDSKLFRDLFSLKILRMDHNRLRHLSHEIISNATHISVLTASYNAITFLPSSIFSNQKSLVNVDFSHNSIIKLTKHLMQNLVRMNTVNFAFNSLKLLYLSHLPVSLVQEHSESILKRNEEMCENSAEDKIPCFLQLSDDYTPEKRLKHNFDFSFNEISQIIYSNTKIAHSLEILNISLAGNFNLSLPLPFIKKESTIICLNLSETKLSWMNLTLFNDILNLPHLKTLNIVGCEACEYYTKNVLLAIFNPNARVIIVCGGNKPMLLNPGLPESLPIGKTRASYNRTSLSPTSTRRSETKLLNYLTFTEHVGNNDFNIKNFEYLSNYPCDFINNKTQIITYFTWFMWNVICNTTIDCAYSSITNLPEFMLPASCILLSHNTLNHISEDYFSLNENALFIDLSYNNLQKLPNKLFRDLKMLRFLTLNNNDLTDISIGLFNDLINLEYLSLHGNSIASFTHNSLAALNKMHSLTVKFKNVNRFFTELQKNQVNLKFLEVHGQGFWNSQYDIYNYSFCNGLSNLWALGLHGFNLNSNFTYTFICSSVLKIITLKNNVLPVLSDGTFKGLRNLTTLKLGGNRIRFLGNFVFRNMTELLYINLSFNEISFLHNDLFLDTTQLRSLDISHNQISMLPLFMFQKLFGLTYLDLSYNFIVNINLRFFSNIPFLEKLYLNSNEAKNVNSDSKNVCSLSQLPPLINDTRICKSNFIFVDDVIWNRQLISEINLCNNSLFAVSKYTFMNLTHVQGIYMCNAKIVEIDDETFTGTVNLRTLSLNENLLSRVNNNLFKNLTHLVWLFLARNRLEFIESKAFVDLHSLRYLYLSFNMLSAFDSASLPAENSLIWLSLNDNLLVPEELNFSELHSLRVLDIGANAFLNITENLFANLYILNSLDLINNSLSKVPKGIFKDIIFLRSLRLNNNCLHSLTVEHFPHLEYLVFLDISITDTEMCTTDSGLSWKNLTLIDYLFDQPNLDCVILTGNAICEDQQRLQLIDNIYLSLKYRTVICSSYIEAPGVLISRDGQTFITHF